MDRLSYIVRRMLQMIPVIFGCTLVVFFMVHLIPGDPARTMLGVRATPQGVAQLHKQWGLGKPLFWVGIIFLLVFSLNLGRLFPVGGYGHGFTGHVHSMFLPGLTIAVFIAPILIRSLRASLLEVLESDYITTARAKGIPERRV